MTIGLFRLRCKDGSHQVHMIDVDYYDRMVAYHQQQGMVHIEPTRLTEAECAKLAPPLLRLHHEFKAELADAMPASPVVS